jgi:divalent metal cation (Fe/Co/Zn/Cd) transporter
MYAKVKECLKEIVAKDSRIVRFHDLRVMGRGGGGMFDLSVDVVVSIRIAENSYDEIAAEVKELLFQYMSGLQNVSVVIEPAYAEESSC